MISPDGFELLTDHPADVPAADLAASYATLLGAAGFSGDLLWAVGLAAEGDGADELVRCVASAPADQQDFTIQIVGANTVTVRPGAAGWEARGVPPAEADVAGLHTWLGRSVELVRRLAATDVLGDAVLRRFASAGARFLPAPPLARWNHAILTDDAEVAAAYPEPSTFWGAWDGRDAIGDRELVWRALDAVSEPDWIRSVLDAQMDLVRAARPGATDWLQAELEPWNEEFLAMPASRLDVVGYAPDLELLELSGYLGRTEHLPLRDLLTIGELVSAGEMADGRPLRTVRVVFPDRDTARREAMPLVDVGAEVYFMDTDGTDVRYEP